MSRKMWGRVFPGLGGEVVISEKGDRVFDFYLLGFDPETSAFAVSSTVYLDSLSHLNFTTATKTGCLRKFTVCFCIVAGSRLYSVNWKGRQGAADYVGQQDWSAAQHATLWL